MLELLGAVYRRSTGELMLLIPEHGRATEINDAAQIYASLGNDQLEVVRVQTEELAPGCEFSLKSSSVLTVAKPPPGESPLEWPVSADAFVHFAMVDAGRKAKLVEMLERGAK